MERLVYEHMQHMRKSDKVAHAGTALYGIVLTSTCDIIVQLILKHF